MAQNSQDGINFNDIKTDGILLGSWPLILSGRQGPDEDGGIVNAVDIDWNGAQIGTALIEGGKINTTGQLITAIKNANKILPSELNIPTNGIFGSAEDLMGNNPGQGNIVVGIRFNRTTRQIEEFNTAGPNTIKNWLGLNNITQHISTDIDFTRNINTSYISGSDYNYSKIWDLSTFFSNEEIQKLRSGDLEDYNAALTGKSRFGNLKMWLTGIDQMVQCYINIIPYSNDNSENITDDSIYISLCVQIPPTIKQNGSDINISFVEDGLTTQNILLTDDGYYDDNITSCVVRTIPLSSEENQNNRLRKFEIIIPRHIGADPQPDPTSTATEGIIEILPSNSGRLQQIDSKKLNEISNLIYEKNKAGQLDNYDNEVIKQYPYNSNFSCKIYENDVIKDISMQYTETFIYNKSDENTLTVYVDLIPVNINKYSWKYILVNNYPTINYYSEYSNVDININGKLINPSPEVLINNGNLVIRYSTDIEIDNPLTEKKYLYIRTYNNLNTDSERVSISKVENEENTYELHITTTIDTNYDNANLQWYHHLTSYNDGKESYKTISYPGYTDSSNIITYINGSSAIPNTERVLKIILTPDIESTRMIFNVLTNDSTVDDNVIHGIITRYGLAVSRIYDENNINVGLQIYDMRNNTKLPVFFPID